MNQEQIKASIASVPAWWHNIEINGVVTPGINSPRAQRWIESFIPEDLSGKDVLDIGAWDGYYSFLAERRGAKRVVATDAYQGPCKPEGFRVAKKLLKSKVQHRKIDVYQIDRIEGSFDHVFFLGVYYHLEDPILALHRIYKKLKPGGTVLIEGVARSGKAPCLYAYRPGLELSPGDFCAATVSWFERVCERIGYQDFRFLSRYPGDNLLEIPVRAFAWYSGLHWGKLKRANRILLQATKPAKPRYSKEDSESRDLFLAQFNLGKGKGNA